MSADIALIWNPTGMDGSELDLNIVDNDLQTTEGLENAVIISLFTDARAPDGQGWDNDPRGYWADAIDGAPTGSLLWLLNRAKADNQYFEDAKKYATDALAWMLEDGVVSSIDVVFTQVDTEVIALTFDLGRPGGNPASFKWFYNWQSQAMMPDGGLNALA